MFDISGTVNLRIIWRKYTKLLKKGEIVLLTFEYKRKYWRREENYIDYCIRNKRTGMNGSEQGFKN
jgi:hypothetical protein